MFHVGAIIELIENDDLMNEEEEKVKLKLSVVFHPKKERKRNTHHHVQNLIDPVCLKTTRERSVAVHRKKF